MFDKTSKVIYVGKSKDIHRRLLQHIGKDTNTAYFIDEVDCIEWLEENNPIFQTLLEAIFIAYHQPKYNDEVKDWQQMEGLNHD
jgi:excinuclease UvrABC nuclease subunit